MKTHFLRFLYLTLVGVVSMTCSSDSPPPAVPVVYNKIYGASSVTLDGDFVVIKVNALPQYKTVYYPQGSDKYAPYGGNNSNFAPKPQTIVEQNMTFRIPLNPKVAATHVATPAGAIGVAVNGVPLYNQFSDASPSLGIDVEINTFDEYNGHTQGTGQYHYHFEPLYLTGVLGHEALLGFLLDGFPVYGPNENGTAVPASNLDVYHGHTSPTADYINGIYHYHLTTAAPYINGDGFYGTPGTVTQ